MITGQLDWKFLFLPWVGYRSFAQKQTSPRINTDYKFQKMTCLDLIRVNPWDQCYPWYGFGLYVKLVIDTGHDRGAMELYV
jgi:hypothetical protein